MIVHVHTHCVANDEKGNQWFPGTLEKNDLELRGGGRGQIGKICQGVKSGCPLSPRFPGKGTGGDFG